MKKVNICIPSCGRPDKLEVLLNSISVNDKGLINKILIVNSTPSHQEEILDKYNELYKKFDLDSIALPWVGPSEARKKGSLYLNKNCKTEYILFLDDDLKFRDGNLKSMVNYLNKKPNNKLCSATWIDHRNGEQSVRPVGYKYIKTNKDGTTTINKMSLSKNQFKSGIVYVDDAQASILARSELLDYLNFDENYAFFMELFDFFYCLHINNIQCAVLLDVVFDHYPGDYKTGSQKRDANIKRNHAVDYFKDKWGVTPQVFA